jgi:hypothetical protein
MKTLILSALIFFSLSANSQPTTITVNPQKKIAEISPMFWGTNFLYWVEDDAALKDGKILQLLKEMPCRLLRYPGGTIADNFNWETGTLENPNTFPYESGDAESSFDEFMDFCKQVKAEPLLVVNTQSWFIKNNIEKGAQYAADWVRYCKEKKYQVKYWEIGNETYWHPIMTAKEYGNLVNVYATAMKKADPDIIISANGHWDVDMVGTKERTEPAKRDEIIERYRQIKSKEDYYKWREFSDGFKEKTVTVGQNKWWNDLISECGNHIDMISVHWYFHENVLGTIDSKLNELKSFLKTKKPEKNYLFCLSEYNCNDKNIEDRVVGLAEGIGRFLVTGVDLATFWPLRIGGNAQRSMLTLDDKTPQYPYQLFSFFSKHLNGKMIECQSPESIYCFASQSNADMTIVVSGRLISMRTEITLNIQQTDLSTKEIKVLELGASESGNSIVLKEVPIEFTSAKGNLKFNINPHCFIVVTINESGVGHTTNGPDRTVTADSPLPTPEEQFASANKTYGL